MRSNIGQCADLYRSLFPSSASPFLHPRSELPPCAVENGGVVWRCLLDHVCSVLALEIVWAV